ncbi:hypothetical protein [Pseudochrobactrum sp. MP213Fo]|uniref:hypothetical protein n=1 Tax=Pseudochrobactrum sp. MP213Fo TaxID=3022250 RepID=UPI003BA26920
MSIILDILLLLGFALFMLAASFIRQQLKAGLRQEYRAAQAEELEAEQITEPKTAQAFGSYKHICSV